MKQYDLSDRRQLAKAITLVESQNKSHWQQAQTLLDSLMPLQKTAMRIGVSGPPGVGKSTMIEALGLYLLKQDLKVAVLAVDPSSPLTGGSLLGDKTRMQKLSQQEGAFIRPAPSRGAHGGVGPSAHESLLVMEASGFDVILVETVGVGQSELAVAGMVDTLLLVLGPYGGDSLQGVKKGILELSDVLCINKADGPSRVGAERAQHEYQQALGALQPHEDAGRWQPPVLLASALEGSGVERLWQALMAHHAWLMNTGLFGKKRAKQAVDWYWGLVKNALLMSLNEHAQLKDNSLRLERLVAAQTQAPWTAAVELLATWRALDKK